ncbi:MAG: hypothetical protein E7464_07395 [Ruminococcaceae bacterium]|nr:hypothetical protein [Oscillospiraceae bacterium]
MKHTVTVRKNRSHRWLIRFLMLIAAILLIWIVIAFHDPLYVLVWFLPILMMSPVAIYYETWQITFSDKGIVKKVFFTKGKSFSYTQLLKVTKAFYQSEGSNCIRMHFKNGKTLQFRMDDEGAYKAEKELLKHCSIKTLS